MQLNSILKNFQICLKVNDINYYITLFLSDSFKYIRFYC